MNKLLIAVVLAFGLILGEARAETRQAALVQAMKDLGAHWRMLSGSGAVYVRECAYDTFATAQLESGAVVSVDLRKTDSLMNPYLGIVQIQGDFVSNWLSPKADGAYFEYMSPPRNACFKTPQEALGHVSAADSADAEGYKHSFVAYYQIEGNKLALSGGNEKFENHFISLIVPSLLEADSPWQRVFLFPIK